MPSCKELMEKKEPIAKEIRRLADLANSEHKWTPEDEANWKKVNDDYNHINAQLEKTKRGEIVDKEMADKYANLNGGKSVVKREDVGDAIKEEGEESFVPVSDEDENEGGRQVNVLRGKDQRAVQVAFTAWARYRHGLKRHHREACKIVGINPSLEYIDIPLLRTHEVRRFYHQLKLEQRAPMATTTGVGGETIPEGFVNAWERSLLYFGGMRETATILRTATGNALPYPTTNDTGQVGELLAENTAAAEQVVATAAIVFNAFKYSSKMIKVSVELLEDTAFDLSAILGSMAGERIARILNTHFTTGTGSGQPNGIVTATAVGFQLGTGNTLGFTVAGSSDGLYQVVHSVDRAYRQAGPNVGWLMHDNTLLKIRLIRDTTNQYIWQPSLSVGESDRLLGYPVTVNNDVAQFAANAEVAIFGALGKYIIRDVAGLRLRRLVERFAELDQECFIAFSRHDGDLLDAGTDPVKSLQASAT